LAEIYADRQRIPYGEGREALLKAAIAVVARSGLRNPSSARWMAWSSGSWR
jgi:hypothetical protein